MKIISACLCGINCKYNGGNNMHPHFVDLYNKGQVFPVCPEELGGLVTPRKPCEIKDGVGADVLRGRASVITSDGQDVTDNFIKGAHAVLKVARAQQAELVILQSRSPSCGVGLVYDGTFKGNLIKGDGVTAALLRQNGIKVMDSIKYLSHEGME